MRASCRLANERARRPLTLISLLTAMAEAHQLHSDTPAQPDITYDPRPSLRYAAAVGLQGAGIGALVSAVQNALGTHNRGAAGFFTRTGGTIGVFGAFA